MSRSEASAGRQQSGAHVDDGDGGAAEFSVSKIFI